MSALGYIIDLGGLGILGLLVVRCYKSEKAAAARTRQVQR